MSAAVTDAIIAAPFMSKAVVDNDGNFRVFAPATTFEKGDEVAGRRLRIQGICTTDDKDKEDETVLARGLDFSEFVDEGWFNDNHSKSTVGVLGYPDKKKGAKAFKSGDALPDGTTAKSSGWFTEGYLIGSKGREIHQLAQDLEGTGRRLGFSIEGKIEKRTGAGGKIIARAKVRNVAITHCPVNAGTSLQALSKALVAAESGGREDGPCITPPAAPSTDLAMRAAVRREVRKALMAGNAINSPGASPGTGFALRTESLEGQTKRTTDGCACGEPAVRRGKCAKCNKLNKSKKRLDMFGGIEFLRDHYPSLTEKQALAIYKYAADRRQAGGF